MVTQPTPLAELMMPYVKETGGLISALRAIQQKLGFLPEDVVEQAAEVFNVSKAEVRGVISFYADFRDQPAGDTVVRLCVAEACQSVGARELQSAVERRLGAKLGSNSSDNKFSVEAVYCLGLCSCAPAAMVGEKLIGRADIKSIQSAIKNSDEAKTNG